jgi:murein DD-endopeptidase MepM/ murein hydrolase activator NlpD
VAFVLLATMSVSGPAVAANGRPFIWPTTGRITQPYGCTGFSAEPRLGSCRHFHGGIDIANNRGTPIRAAAAGVVTHVGWDIWGTHAWMVMINHGGGVQTWYAHMRGKQIPGLHRGTRVRQGQVIGYMDSTGQSTGVHLHWAVVKNGHYVNPKNYVDDQPFRPRSNGSPTSAAACDDVWIASVDGAVTAAVTEGEDGAGGSDTNCAA